MRCGSHLTAMFLSQFHLIKSVFLGHFRSEKVNSSCFFAVRPVHCFSWVATLLITHTEKKDTLIVGELRSYKP